MTESGSTDGAEESAGVGEASATPELSVTAAESTADTHDDDDAAQEPTEKEWWDDPALPWRHKPGRRDIACWIWIAVVAVWAVAMLPLRPVIFGLSPPLAAAITGGRVSVVATGAFAQVEGGPLVLYWLLSTLAIVKFDWIFWWAGNLWGDGFIDVYARRSPRARRQADRAMKLAARFGTPSILVTYLPVPLPSSVIYAAVGASGMTLRRFLIVDTLAAAVAQALYLGLGWWIGEPAVALVKIYADYMWYLSIGVLVVMFLAWTWRRNRGQKPAPDLPPGPLDKV